MLHNGAETRGGQGSSKSTKDQWQLHHLEEESSGISRSQLKATPSSSPLTSTRCIVSKSTSDKASYQQRQFTIQRPSVLRKGNQTLPHALSSQSSLGNCSSESMCKDEIDNKLSCDTDGPSQDSAMGSPRQTTLVYHTQPPQVASESVLGGVHSKEVCKWPGCKETFKDNTLYLKHLHSEHPPGDKTIQQWRMQRDMVQRMENQLIVEKQKLHFMFLHLFKPNSRLKQSTTQTGSLPLCQGLNSLHGENIIPTNMLPPGFWQIPTSQFFTGDPMEGILSSIECYQYTNIRPPFTYASMIRLAILESPEKQLTLNEIYHWFTRKFGYFRHNTATWKNAVRHNLSLHKCFVRAEGGKGSVWTVDEAEFLKRKGQKLHRYHL